MTTQNAKRKTQKGPSEVRDGGFAFCVDRFALRRSRRGAAVMLVLVLLMLLIAMAVPFVFIMAQQEGTSAGSLNAQEAQSLARHGSDHALARLNASNRLNEYGVWYSLLPSEVSTHDDPANGYPRFVDLKTGRVYFDDPHVDGLLEYNVDVAFELYNDRDKRYDLYPRLRDTRGNKLFGQEDSVQQVCGVNVRDESGKVNLNAATPDLIGNLLGSGQVVEESFSTGGAYEKLVLDDASWLNDPDEKPNANGAFGGGFIVADGHLMSYEARRGNTLYALTADPTYNAVAGATAIFTAAGTSWNIYPGTVVTSVQAYKLAYNSVLASSDGRNLASFNNLGEVRAIGASEWMPRGRYSNFFEGVNPVLYQNLLQEATVVAPTLRFDGRWFYGHVVTSADIQDEGETGKTSNLLIINFDNIVQPDFYSVGDPRSPQKQTQNGQPNPVGRGIGKGQIVRIRHANGATSLGVTLRGNRNGNLTVMTPNQVSYLNNEPVTIEVAERARVNINTASFPVLVACFKYLGHAPKKSGLTPQIAERLAGDILARTADPQNYFPFRNYADFYAFLQARLLDPMDSSGTRYLPQEDIDAIARVQLYPYAPQSMNTAQFSYESLDAYCIESLAARFAPNGNRLSQSRSREWVLAGNDAAARYHWSLFDQLESEQKAPQGNILTLFRAGTVNDRVVPVIELPYVHYYNSERWMRKRFDPPFVNRPMDIAALAPDNANPPEDFFINVNAGRGDMTAGAFSFWYRPRYGQHNHTHYIFDSADSEHSNRMSLLWWGDRRRGYKLANKNNGLVFRIKDRTLEAAYTELRYELDPSMFRDNEWYHFMLNFKGTDLSQVELLIDGDSRAGPPGSNTLAQVTPITNHTYMLPNGAWVSRTTPLQDDLPFVDLISVPSTTPQALLITELRIDPQDIRSFSAPGVVRIGDEAIEYNQVDAPGCRLLGIRRSARGTTARDHPRDAKITAWGYTHQMDQWTTGQTTPVAWEPQFPFLPATTGQLRSNTGDKPYWRVAKNGTPDSAYDYAVTMGPESGFPGCDKIAFATRLPLKDYSGMPERGIVAVVGIAWDRYIAGGPAGGLYPDFEPPPPDGTDVLNVPELPAQQRPSFADIEMEFVYYDGISANGLNVVARFDDRFQLKQQNKWLHFLGEYDPVAIGWWTGSPPPASPPSPALSRYNFLQFFSQGSCVILLSLDVTSSGGYHDVSFVQVDDEWFFYNARFPGPLSTAVSGQLLACIDHNPHKNPGALNLPRNTLIDYVFGLASQNPTNPWYYRNRGCGGSGVAYHPAPTPITPVFCTARYNPLAWPPPPNVNTAYPSPLWPEPPCGRSDVVTMIHDVNADKELHFIRNQRVQIRDYYQLNPNGTIYIDPVTLQPVIIQRQPYYLAALVNNCNHDYRRADPSWICKFPTGELPVQIPTAFSFAAPFPGTVDAGGTTGALLGPHTGDFDSFEFRSYAKGPFAIVDGMTVNSPGEQGDIQVTTIAGLPQNVGIIHVDDELIAYRGTTTRQTPVLQITPQGLVTATVQTFWLTDITRGVLGSQATAHAPGTGIMNMASLRLAKPAGMSGFRPSDARLFVLPGEQQLRDFGFVRIYEGNNYEVAGYQKFIPVVPATNPPQGEIICGRYDPRTLQGPWRGVYGTRAQNFSSRALVLDQPIRFPDWAPSYCEQGQGMFQRGPGDERAGLPCANSPEISYMQGSATFRNSDFEDIVWRISYTPYASELAHADSIVARLVVRFDGQGEWGDVPTNAPGGLWSFNFNPNGATTTDIGNGIKEQVNQFWPMTATAGTRKRFDRIEWRVYFLFLPGAFDREDYKISLQFHGCDIGLRQVTRVVRHEEQR